MYDVIVVGGGLLGLATAYYLVDMGASTLLIDRADAGQATRAGAGIIGPDVVTTLPDGWLEFALRAAAHYPSLIEELESAGAHDTGYTKCGLLVVAMLEGELDAFEDAKSRMLDQQRMKGMPGADILREVTSDEASELFPLLAPVGGAIYHGEAARVDGRRLARALSLVAGRRGLVVKQASVE